MARKGGGKPTGVKTGVKKLGVKTGGNAHKTVKRTWGSGGGTTGTKKTS